MGKNRCDPIDYPATLAALAEQSCGLVGGSRDAATLRRLYVDYASVAARPYGRRTWELMLRAEQRRFERLAPGSEGSKDGPGHESQKPQHILTCECVGRENNP